MLLFKRFLGVALAAPLALAACGGDGGKFDLTLVHEDCTGQIDFLPQAAELTIRVTGKDMDPVEVKAPASSGSAEIPDVPFGSGRVVTVSAKAGGRVVAYGQSTPFTVTESDSASVTVLLQGVNRFTGAADVTNQCVEMTTQRAGHTAVLLADGRVLLVGGFRVMNLITGLPEARSGFADTAEAFDPSLGVFVPVAKPCAGDACYGAAHGRGVLLPDGRAFIAGGVNASGVNAVAIKTAMIYEPKTNSWTAKEMASARHGHSVHLIGGKVLVVGGIDEVGNVLTSTEIFDPQTNEFTAGPAIPAVSLGEPINAAGRAFHAAASINDATVMLGGGLDSERAIAPSIIYFLADKDGSIKVETGTRPATLTTPVIYGGAGVIEGAFVVAGGTTEHSGSADRWTVGKATKAVQWTLPSSTPGPNNELQLLVEHAAPCVVPMDGQRLLVMGGVSPTRKVIDWAEVLAWNSTKKTVERSFIGDSSDRSKSGLARAYATCTNLGDNRILVTGGATGDGGNADSSAEIFVVRQLN